MAKLESTNWVSKPVSMKINGTLRIPEAALVIEPPISNIEIASPLEFQPTLHHLLFPTPTESEDSGFTSWPTSLESAATSSPERFEFSPRPFHKHFFYGGPGFSIAVLDSSTGSIDHIPVPLPSRTNLEDINCDNFSQAEVLSMAVVGESQIWVGTENGSLHVFELTPDLRFSMHSYTNLVDPVLCITSRQSTSSPENSPGRQNSRIDVLLGCPNGNVKVIGGERNERGGLKNALKGPRKVLQLGNLEEEGSINCIVHVNCGGVDMFWCGCGKEIVVLRRSDWRELVRLDGKVGCPSQPSDNSDNESQQVVQLLSTECGVWSRLSNSSTISLWNTKDFSPKLHIVCCNYGTMENWLDDFPQILTLTFSYPLLFVGTNGGHLLVFKMLEDSLFHRRRNSLPLESLTNIPSPNRTLLDYRLLAATHCSSRPVVSIQATPLRNECHRSPCGSPMGTPYACMQVLVVCGAENNSREVLSSGQVHIYELITSPTHSPGVSPASGRCSSRDRSLSVSSTGSFSLRRNATLPRSLPKLTLHSVSPKPLTFLPLKD